MNYLNKWNEYVKIRREEQKNYEKDIVNKCKNHPKLFYRYVNGKLKDKKETSKLRINDEINEDAEEMNNYLHSIFTRESDFQCQRAMGINEVGLNKRTRTREGIRVFVLWGRRTLIRRKRKKTYG